ncbi:MAG: transcriptional regulator [Myxococcales bacterium]|nr:transcriptional regulator [Myxococcales bacterium]
MSAPSPQIPFAVGDRVVYPNQGVCRVFGVEAKEVAGQKLTFLTMKREEDGAVVMVPQAKVQSVGLRKVASAQEVEKVYTFLRSDSDKADLDWKQRARTNAGRMAQGGILGLAEVVKGLQVLSELRPLPNKERELYDNARHLLVSEISVALGIPEHDAEDSVDVILFPVGRERPKRTAAEFKAPGGDEEMGIGEDMIDLESPEMEIPAEVPEAPEEETTEEALALPKVEGPPTKARLSDEEVTVTQTTGSGLVPQGKPPLKRKRGRPPKPKPAEKAHAAPKKRGRPPKAKPLVEVHVPKKRGRPPKAKAKKK